MVGIKALLGFLKLGISEMKREKSIISMQYTSAVGSNIFDETALKPYCINGTELVLNYCSNKCSN